MTTGNYEFLAGFGGSTDKSEPHNISAVNSGRADDEESVEYEEIEEEFEEEVEEEASSGEYQTH